MTFLNILKETLRVKLLIYKCDCFESSEEMKKQNQTYNDGILELLVQQTLYDRYHTKIGSDYSTFKRFWFRKLGITSEEQYFCYASRYSCDNACSDF